MTIARAHRGLASVAQEKLAECKSASSSFDSNEEDNSDNQLYTASDEGESLSEALLAVASAEEYAAKISRIQQACLTPLKEDLADWLNKIMDKTDITSQNFMDKLDNGVIVCRLARIISMWCNSNKSKPTDMNIKHNHSDMNSPSRVSSGQQHTATPAPNIATPVHMTMTSSYFKSSSTTSLNCGNVSTGPLRIDQTKIWEDAKCKTFYARDNVCNFIRWSKEFGVNQSVLFESDDLVLHGK